MKNEKKYIIVLRKCTKLNNIDLQINANNDNIISNITKM